MIAFVLGGGGTRGAAQAGAVRALLEKGIVPDMLVGTSVGAINAAFLAFNPTLEDTATLEASWCALKPEMLIGSSRPWVALRAMRGKPSFYSSDGLRRFLIDNTPANLKFGNSKKELYIVASELYSGTDYVFGDRPKESVLDAIMASTAIPPYFPPVAHDGVVLVDGSITSPLPLRIAIQRGATEIYAIDISLSPLRLPTKLRVWTVGELAIGAMLRKQVQDEVTWTELQLGITLHHIQVPFHYSSGTWNVEAVGEYIELGYEHCKSFLLEVNLPGDDKRPIKRVVAQALGTLRRSANAIARGVRRALARVTKRKASFEED